MIRLIQRKLIIPRGDTGTFSIPMLGNKDSGDMPIFTIFDPLTHRKIFEKVLQLSDGVLSMDLTHGDTVNLPVGQYVWDIKFYDNPIIVDDQLVSGEEVDSYYSAFQLPVCEIRETGDNLLMADDAPTSKLAPDQINYIDAAVVEIQNSKQIAVDSAAEAVASATAATASATAAYNSEVAALAAQVAAEVAQSEAAASATAAAASLAQMEIDLSTKANVADLAAVATSGEYSDLLHAPTNVSAFTNDAGYLTQHQDISGKANSADLATVATSGSYNDLLNKPSIPSKVSDLTDDSGHYTKPVGGIPAEDLAETYLTQHQDISGKANSADLAAVATSGAYSDLSGTPTNVSSFTNDAGYLTSFTETDPTVPSWAKAVNKPTYTASEIGAPTVSEMNTAIATAIGNVHQFGIEVVQELPVSNIKEHTVYFVPKTGETNDVYDEYIYVNNNWEMIGNTQIDLSSYVQKTDYANGDHAGVIIGSTNAYGTRIVNGSVVIVSARDEDIKAATDYFKPITSKYQHTSTFYGLAKAAGDTTQSQSDNAVGTYTTEAKTAIQNMLGVADASQIAIIPGTGEYSAKTRDILFNGNTISQTASELASFAEGVGTTASGKGAHAQGQATIASGYCSHSEGTHSQANGYYSHTEGGHTRAEAYYSHAEGEYTIAAGMTSHVLGKYNIADIYDDINWPEWVANTEYVIGNKVKITTVNNNETTTQGYICKTANSDSTFTASKWINQNQLMNYVEIVGNGTDVNNRSNAYALDWKGNGHYMGNIYVGVNADSTGGTRLATITEVAAKLDASQAGLKVVRLI